MKKLLLVGSLASLLLLGGCKFLWWGKDEPKTPTVIQNTTKSSFNDVYSNFVASWEQKVIKLASMQSIQHKNENVKLGVGFDINNPMINGQGNVNFDMESKTSLPANFDINTQLKDIMFDGMLKLSGNLSGSGQGQVVNMTFNSDMLLSIVGGKLYGKINELSLKDANNPSYEAMLSAFPNLKGNWIELLQIPDMQDAQAIPASNPTDVINLMKDILVIVKKTPVLKVLEEKTEGNVKVFVTTLDEDNFVALMKEISQLPSLEKLSGEKVTFTQEDEDMIRQDFAKIKSRFEIKVSDTDGTSLEIKELDINGTVNITGVLSDKTNSLVIESKNDGLKVTIDVTKNGENYKLAIGVFQSEISMGTVSGDFNVKDNNNFYDVKGTMQIEGNGFKVHLDVDYVSTEGTQLNISAPTGAKSLQEVMMAGMGGGVQPSIPQDQGMEDMQGFENFDMMEGN